MSVSGENLTVYAVGSLADDTFTFFTQEIAVVSHTRTVARLGTVDPGARIDVALDDGSVRRYEVVERAIYGKLELPEIGCGATRAPRSWC